MPVVLLAVAAALVVVPIANSEQAGSKAKRLPAGLIDSSGGNTCAIVGNGQVRCWGQGGSGQLGYGNTNMIGDTETPASVGPVKLGAGRKAVAVSLGGSDACALLDNGSVRCWGYNYNSRLGYPNPPGNVGDDETPDAFGPVDLGSGRTATAIAAGGQHTCVILDTAAVRCWGWGQYGQLGYGNSDQIGDTETPGSVGPVDLGVGRTAVAISAGGIHTCALLDDATVRCWGEGSSGQLGYGNLNVIGDTETPGSVGPVDLGAGRTAVAISVGAYHTCAILDTGAVRCWGLAGNGQLGYGNTDIIGDGETPGSVGPVPIGAGRKAVAISAGSYHTCVILDNGKVRCWGDGASGQLGYGNTNPVGDTAAADSVGTVAIGAGRTAVAISAGFNHTCAVLDNGRVRCWGSGADGALGYGNTTSIGDTETPGTVGPVNLGGLVGAPAISLAATKRDKAGPYRIKASGKLTGLIVKPATCTGKVLVKAKKGKKSVSKRASLKYGAGACKYSATLTIKSTGKWKVTATFLGTNSLLARASAARTFTAG